MPAENQPNGPGDEYPSEPYKMLATKNDATIRAIVRGIDDVDRATAYIRAEVQLADDEDRDIRKPLIGLLNSKKTSLAKD